MTIKSLMLQKRVKNSFETVVYNSNKKNCRDGATCPTCFYRIHALKKKQKKINKDKTCLSLSAPLSLTSTFSLSFSLPPLSLSFFLLLSLSDSLCAPLGRSFPRNPPLSCCFLDSSWCSCLQFVLTLLAAQSVKYIRIKTSSRNQTREVAKMILQ